MLEQIKYILQQGGIGAIPTETVYGLAANALDVKAVAKIFEVKNRPTFDPLIIHTDTLSKVKQWVLEVPPQAELLASSFWPGPLTLLLPKHHSIPDLVTSGLPHVAIRIPNHPLTLELLDLLDFPLAAPSANPFSYISPTTAQHVEEQLGEKIDFILDGGACSVGIESTIVGFEGNQPVVYRLGGLSIEALEDKIGKVVIKTSSSNPKAPGMLEVHYAPGIPLVLTESLDSELEKWPNKRIGIMSLYPKNFPQTNIFFESLSVSGDVTEAASNLFQVMRYLDQQPIDLIIAEKMPNEGLGRAINDRLLRAAQKR